MDKLYDSIIKELKETKFGKKLVKDLKLERKNAVKGGSFNIKGTGEARFKNSEKFFELVEKMGKDIDVHLRKKMKKERKQARKIIAWMSNQKLQMQ